MTTFHLDRIPDPEANPPRADLLLAQQRPCRQSAQSAQLAHLLNLS